MKMTSLLSVLGMVMLTLLFSCKKDNLEKRWKNLEGSYASEMVFNLYQNSERTIKCKSLSVYPEGIIFEGVYGQKIHFKVNQAALTNSSEHDFQIDYVCIANYSFTVNGVAVNGIEHKEFMQGRKFYIDQQSKGIKLQICTSSGWMETIYFDRQKN